MVPLPPFVRSLNSSHNVLFHRKYKFHCFIHQHYYHTSPPPECTNLINIRKTVYKQLQPIHFEIKNDPNFGSYAYDEHFSGILVSPLFESLNYYEMRELVKKALQPIGMASRVRLVLEPPSRFNKLRQRVMRHFPMENNARFQYSMVKLYETKRIHLNIANVKKNRLLSYAIRRKRVEMIEDIESPLQFSKTSSETSEKHLKTDMHLIPSPQSHNSSLVTKSGKSSKSSRTSLRKTPPRVGFRQLLPKRKVTPRNPNAAYQNRSRPFLRDLTGGASPLSSNTHTLSPRISEALQEIVFLDPNTGVEEKHTLYPEHFLGFGDEIFLKELEFIPHTHRSDGDCLTRTTDLNQALRFIKQSIDKATQCVQRMIELQDAENVIE